MDIDLTVSRIRGVLEEEASKAQSSSTTHSTVWDLLVDMATAHYVNLVAKNDQMALDRDGADYWHIGSVLTVLESDAYESADIRQEIEDCVWDAVDALAPSWLTDGRGVLSDNFADALRQRFSREALARTLRARPEYAAWRRRNVELQWVDTTGGGTPRVLTFDEVEELGLNGTLRGGKP
jgi:hypothetical protein